MIIVAGAILFVAWLVANALRWEDYNRREEEYERWRRKREADEAERRFTERRLRSMHETPKREGPYR